MSLKFYKRKLRRRAEREVSKRLKVDEIMSKVNARYVLTSDTDSELDDCNLSYLNRVDECDIQVHYLQQNPVPNNNVSSSDEEINNDRNDSLLSINDESDDDGPGVDFVNNNERNVVEFENDAEREEYTIETVREWALEAGHLSMRKLDDLLNRLSVVFPRMPRNYKILLHTPAYINVVQFHDGCEFWYKSIEANLNAMDLREYLQKYDCIKIGVNMDGLPLFQSSKKKFWPILGYLVGTENEPFIIALYLSKQDPRNPAEFLNNFVNEVQNLQENGYICNGVAYPFEVRNYILDAPARSLVKCIIGHSGYGSCEKCTVVGQYVDGRITYVQLDKPLRTDESFRNMSQRLHHTGVSILSRIAGMISQFRLDPMHLIWQGVWKRLLKAFMLWKGPWQLDSNTVREISAILENDLLKTCPQDFARPPRSLTEWKFYKATELRRLCLYNSILIFKGRLHENVYKHFLLLHSALYILSSPVLVHSMLETANELLQVFIHHSVNIYGQKFVVYNVHALCHLTAECAAHGQLENFSAFKFENRLKSLKAILRSGYKPLQQAAYRDLERSTRVIVRLHSNDKHVTLSQRHRDPNEVMIGTHFRRVSVGEIFFQLGRKDSCFRTIDGNIVVLRNIVHNEEGVFMIGNMFLNVENFYTYPLDSCVLGIARVSEREHIRRSFPLIEVESKCWLMPDGDAFLCVPLLHTMPLF